MADLRLPIRSARADHYCARCLHTVGHDTRECPRCSRRFVGRGRFDRLAGSPPPASSLRLMDPTRR